MREDVRATPYVSLTVLQGCAIRAASRHRAGRDPPRSGGVASSSRPARQRRAARPSARRPCTVRVTRSAAPHPPGMPHPAVRRRPHPHPAASRRSRFPSWRKITVWGKGEARIWRGHRLVRQSLWPYFSFWLFSTMRFPGRRADGERPATRRACTDAPFPSNRGRDPPPNGDSLPARGKRTNMRPRTLAGERSRVPAASRPHRFKSPRGARDMKRPRRRGLQHSMVRAKGLASASGVRGFGRHPPPSHARWGTLARSRSLATSPVQVPARGPRYEKAPSPGPSTFYGAGERT